MNRDPFESFLKQNRSVPAAAEDEAQKIWAHIQKGEHEETSLSEASLWDKLLKILHPLGQSPIRLSFACAVILTIGVGGLMHLQKQRYERRVALINTPDFQEAVDWQLSTDDESFI